MLWALLLIITLAGAGIFFRLFFSSRLSGLLRTTRTSPILMSRLQQIGVTVAAVGYFVASSISAGEMVVPNGWLLGVVASGNLGYLFTKWLDIKPNGVKRG